MSQHVSSTFSNFEQSQPQVLDCSPTPTPYHTRAGSPARGKLLPHTSEQASQNIAILHAAVKEPAKVSEPLKIPVSVIDGSANVSGATKVKYLIAYLVFNLGLTVYNKAVMIKFPFPFLLTALHAAAGCLGTNILVSRGNFMIKPLAAKECCVILAFSLLYTANIAISNVSLAMVTLAFHQVFRATTPVFCVAIYRVIFSSTYGAATYVSLVPMILGVGLATYGDYYATTLGFCMTLLGAILAAVKTVVTNCMQTAGLHLSAVEILYRLSPLALLQSLVAAYLNGEVSDFQSFVARPGNLNNSAVLILLVNAAMAFGLNFTSFTANKKAGALTMTVAANMKQALTVLLAILFWELEVGWMNALGIIITLFGSAWYARLEFISLEHPNSSHLMSNMEEGKTEDT